MFTLFANTGIQFIKLPYSIKLDQFVKEELHGVSEAFIKILKNSFTPLSFDGTKRDFVRIFWRQEGKGLENLRPILLIDTKLGEESDGALTKFDLGDEFRSNRADTLFCAELRTMYNTIFEGIAAKREIEYEGDAYHEYKKFVTTLLQASADKYFEMDDFDAQLFNFTKERLGRFHLRELASNNPISTNLYFDLGNTRSVGLTFEDHGADDGSMSNYRPFELVDYTNYFKPSVRPKENVHQTLFSSFFEFRSSPFPVYDVTNTFKLLSIASIGVEAFEHKLSSNIYNSSTGLSGPKRYIWDEEQYSDNWHFSDKPNRKIEGSVLSSISLIDKDDFNNHNYTSSPVETNYPRRTALIHFVLEILEQAFRQVNSIKHRLDARFNSPRQIQRLVFSYPSGMSDLMKERFLKQIEKAVEIFKHHYGLSYDIDVALGLDEASTSQIVLLKSFEHRYGHRYSNFLDCATSKKGNKVTIGSIDIGGGTTDFMVADYDKEQLGRGIIDGKIKFLDGVEYGGDDLLKDLMKLIVEDLLIKQEIIPEHVYYAMQDEMNASNRSIRLQFLSGVVRPIALAYLMSTTNPELRSILQNSKDRLFKLMTEKLAKYDIIESVTVLNDVKSELINKYPELNETLNVAIDFSAITSDDIIKAIKGSNLFRNVLNSYEFLISNYLPDFLVVSGKLSSLPTVMDKIKSLIPTYKHKIVSLDGFVSGEWYPFSSNGKISDPKTSVVVGLAIEDVGKSKRFLDGLRANLHNPFNSSKKFIFKSTNGRMASPESVVYNPIDGSVEKIVINKQRTLLKTSVLAADKNVYVNPAYEIRLSDGYLPDMDDLPYCYLTVENGQLSIDKTKFGGKVKNNDSEKTLEFDPSLVELKLKTLSSSQYYLDTGSL